MHRFADLLILGLLALAAAVAGGGCARDARNARESAAPVAAGADPVLADLGAQTFVRHCASCHGASARGDGPAASALRTPPADLTRIAARRGGEFPPGEIARFIDGRFGLVAHGSREMPVWGDRLGERVPEAGVSEEVVRGQISVLVEYLKSIQVAD
jgi:mono/diheme cytochrome c family protein